ncbi:GNAT family protein [Bacillus pseudomycoides]|uniref:GNAT family protein n=1 Tax=Bacillus bingmayongensis TaxID=1150157 RepID=A0ABU5JTM3_9BACI|nr:GNAT family protein [Bacillus pseudomycoides]
MIGTCGFIEYDARENKAELTYALSCKYWGRCMATETAATFLKYGFERLKLNKIEAGCHTSNEQSERVMKRLGMEYDRTIENNSFVRDTYRDTKRYFITCDIYDEINRGE